MAPDDTKGSDPTAPSASFSTAATAGEAAGPPLGYVALSGSVQPPQPGVQVAGPAAPDEQIQASLLLRRKTALPAAAADMAGGRVPMGREQFAAEHGADPQDVARVRAFAEQKNLLVAAADAARRTVTLAGTVRSFEDAFGVKLIQYRHEGGAYRGLSGPIFIPADLAGIVVAVLGLDTRPAAHPH